MPNALAYEKLTRVINATAAGTTNVNGTAIDMQDFETVVFEACLGTLTATQVTGLKAQQSADGSTNWTDITGAAVGPMQDTQSNEMLLLEVYRPRQRYVRAVVTRGTANAVIDSVVARQRGAKKVVTTQDATTVSAAATVVGS